MEKNIEFEEMKQQLHQLQQRIDNHVEINEQQTRRAIDDGLGSLRRKDERSYRLCLLMAFILPVALYLQGIPRTLIITTFLFLLGNAAWRKHLNSAHDKIAGASLIETSKRLLKYKRDERNSLLLAFPLAILWCALYIVNLCDLPRFEGADLTYLYIGIAVSAILGFVIGLTKFYLPQQRAADRLLRQIEEVQSEK